MKQTLLAFFVVFVFGCHNTSKEQNDLALEPKLILPIGHTDVVNSATFSPTAKKL